MATEIKTGDLVRLKSGGPTMTVAKTVASLDERGWILGSDVWCDYFDSHGKACQSSYESAQLELVQEPPKPAPEAVKGALAKQLRDRVRQNLLARGSERLNSMIDKTLAALQALEDRYTLGVIVPRDEYLAQDFCDHFVHLGFKVRCHGVTDQLGTSQGLLISLDFSVPAQGPNPESSSRGEIPPPGITLFLHE